ncbi:MAG: hypothetical protein NC923_05025 [Candidatus Omnitrophica bacterium]|nr:hypothetical protein [Candidatus Omnitrophota bacterium]
MNENISPEEKLLRLIKGEKKPSAYSSAQNIVSEIKAESIDRQKSFFLVNLINAWVKTIFSSANLHKIVSGALLLSLIYLVFVFVYPLFGLKVKFPEVPQGIPKGLEDISKQENQSFESRQEQTLKRQIFANPSTLENPISAAVESQSIKDINLVGIIAGENPQAIIKDNKTQQIFYLSKGQFIGEFQIEEIQDGKIILERNEEKFELFM